MNESENVVETEVKEEVVEKSLEEKCLEDAVHYLGGFMLPLKEDTLREVTNDETGEKSIELDKEFALRYKAFVSRMDQMNAELKAFKDYAYKFLSERNWTEPVSAEGVNLLLTKPYKRTNVKSSELKEVLPQIFELFSKEINVSGSVGIKIVEDEYNPWDFLKK